MLALSGEAGYEFRLLEAVIAADQEQRSRIVDKVRQAVGGDLGGTTIGLWGLAFKAGTDDVRASPAVDIADALIAEGARIQAYDPEGHLDREVWSRWAARSRRLQLPTPSWWQPSGPSSP